MLSFLVMSEFASTFSTSETFSSEVATASKDVALTERNLVGLDI